MKNNKKMLLLVGILIAIIGISFAYFIVSSLIRGEGSKGVITTANINGATINTEGTLNFNDLDILPGHKTVSGIKLTATGNNELIPYNLIWEGTNTINTPLNYTVYKVNEKIDATATCSKKKGVKNGASISYEECEITKLNELGDSISNGTILKNSEKEILASDEFITATNTGNIVYYYVILEYPNLDEPQNIDIGGSFNGKIKAEKNDAKLDLVISSLYIKQDDDSYQKVSTVPVGYELDKKNSSCTNGATPNWTDNNLLVNGYSKSTTSCDLYFVKSGVSAIKAQSNGLKTEFTGVADYEDTGVYEAPDDYTETTGQNSYYFRGVGDELNNWVKFAGFYWRIIRINGNDTIRMIYSGAASGNPSAKNKIGNTTIINETTYKYNTASYYDNAYIGYMIAINNSGSTTSSTAHQNNYDSNVKKEIDKWYSTNITSRGFSSFVDVNTGFCNDRTVDKTVETGYTGDGYGSQRTGYAPWGRLYQNGSARSVQTPILKCSNKSRDLFTINNTNTENIGNKKLTYPVGMITSDEAVFAGGFGDAGSPLNYLATGLDYWTMSPVSSYNEIVFQIQAYMIKRSSISNLGGIRPVINLKAGTNMTGIGSETDPYVVVGGN